MKTILIALGLYFAFVVMVFIARLVFWLSGELKKENARMKARQAEKERVIRYDNFTEDNGRENNQILVIREKPDTRPLNRATIAAYEKQKEITLERIADIEYTLDLAPRGKEREDLQVKRLRLYNDLANIENKIYRVSK